MTSYKNKTAFITGAASGIGFALTKALLAKDANIMMADIDRAGLDAALEKLGGQSEQLS